LSKEKYNIIAAGMVGLVAAIGVGAGEFLLHFDALGRFTDGYAFMQGISTERTTTGHFIGVLAAPLYLVGFWHVMKMLEPANRLASRIAFAIMSYGIIVGVVWIGSRAGISTVINDAILITSKSYIPLYELRYENLLQITRFSVLIFSILFVWLVLSGRSYYPRWVAVLNPVFLILTSFAIWMLVPNIGV